MGEIADDMATSTAYDAEHHKPGCKRGWMGGECCGGTSSYEYGGACNNCPMMQDCTCHLIDAAPQHVGPCPGMGGPFGCNCDEGTAAPQDER